jgi:chemotaxis protein methyltransferase CheR
MIQNLYHSLVEGGWLVVSPVETSRARFSQFAPINFPGAILYRKNGHRPQRLEDFAPEALPEQAPGPLQLPLDVAVSPSPPNPGARREPDAAGRGSVAAVFREERALEPQEHPATVSPPPLDREALALYAQGHYAEAEEKTVGWLSAHPDEAKAMSLLARVYANQGKLAEANAWCERAIARDRLNPSSYYLHAAIQEECGQDGEAVKSLKRALYLDQSFVLAHFALGNLALRQGDFKAAGKYFENTLELLGVYQRDDLVPESEGMTAGRLVEIVRLMTGQKRWA